MITLEEKIIPYLPYGVGYYYSNLNDIKLLGILTTKSTIHNLNNVFHSLGKSFFLGLKPISDLSNLVKTEFEKYDGLISGKANEEIITLFCEENGVGDLIENIELSSLPYECVNFIFKNHYDFFGLIEEGLAININEL